MREFIFEKRKYGFELLMDLHKFEGNPKVFFDPEPHTTDFFEIMIFEKANGSIELNGKLLEIEDNSLFFISPFQKKRCEIQLEGIKGYHLVFQNDFLSDFFDDKLFTYRLQYFYNSQHPQYVRLKKEDYQILKFALDQIIAEIHNFQSDSRHIIRSLLYFTLSKLNRSFSRRYNISPDTHSDSTVYRFKELLELKIRKHQSVGTYCRLLQVSRHQLNQLMKAHSGCPTKQMINDRLLQEVKMELRFSEKTVSEIAHALNFSEPNNLTRFFKIQEGVSPTTYRENYQNDR